MNRLALVQRKIKLENSKCGKITTVKVAPETYYNFANTNDKVKPKDMNDFERALNKAFEAFDKVLKEEMES